MTPTAQDHERAEELLNRKNRPMLLPNQLALAIAEERERCAKVIEGWPNTLPMRNALAAKIREGKP